MINWDYKFLLVFLKKELEIKGIISSIYHNQVLKLIVFLLFDKLGFSFIFIKNDLKIYFDYI